MPIVTLDPSYNSAANVFSNGNLTVQNNSANSWHPARATNSFLTGKLYFEMTVNAVSGTGAQAGVLDSTPNSSNYIGSDTNGVGYQTSGSVAYAGGSLGNIGSWTTGDVICVAFDIGNAKVWFRKNAGNWDNTTHNPATNTGGYAISALLGVSGIYPAACCYAAGDRVTMNFGATAFAQAVPAGFTSVNSSGAIAQARVMVMA